MYYLLDYIAQLKTLILSCQHNNYHFAWAIINWIQLLYELLEKKVILMLMHEGSNIKKFSG